MLSFRTLFFSFFLAVITTMISLAQASIHPAPEDVPITHVLVSITQLPGYPIDVDIRMHLPNNNFVECKEAAHAKLFKLEHPIDPTAESASYYVGYPCSFIGARQYPLETVEEDNGQLWASFWTFRLPDEGTGPFEETGQTALWPPQEGAQNLQNPVLHLSLQYFPKDGYRLSYAFTSLKYAKKLARPKSAPA